MKAVQSLKRLLRGPERKTDPIDDVAEQCRMLVAGIDNQSRDINEKLEAIVSGLTNQSRVLNEKLSQLVQGSMNQSELLNDKFNRSITEAENLSQTVEGRLSQMLQRLDNNVRGQGKRRPNGSGSYPRGSSGQLAPFEPAHKKALLDEADVAAVRAGWLDRGRDGVAEQMNVLDTVKPWSGRVPPGFGVDFLGVLTDLQFTRVAGTDFVPKAAGISEQVQTVIPKMSAAQNVSDAETWFEAVDWVIAAREARDRYVMITLGAHFGAQAVGACRALQVLNPLPYKLVAVEPVPESVAWIERHMRNNGIDPADQWIIPLSIGDRTDPVYFPVGAPGLGANNCVATNELEARKKYADQFVEAGQAESALRNLLMHNTTGLTEDLVPGRGLLVEIRLVSAITLSEVLSPFDFVDFLEADIQQSEILVFPPFIDLLRKKVRRIHIGTHGQDVHWTLHHLFEDSGWQIVFSYEPNARHHSAAGDFEINDGVLTVRNPDL